MYIVIHHDHRRYRKGCSMQVTGVRHRFRLVRGPENLASLAGVLYEKLMQRERREVERLEQVAALVEHDGCQVPALGKHFGDPLGQPCGHCSCCLQGGRSSRVPLRRTRTSLQSSGRKPFRCEGDTPLICNRSAPSPDFSAASRRRTRYGPNYRKRHSSEHAATFHSPRCWNRLNANRMSCPFYAGRDVSEITASAAVRRPNRRRSRQRVRGYLEEQRPTPVSSRP